MKKEYEKPTADIVSFQLQEDLTITGSTGSGEIGPGDPGGWHSLGKGDYQIQS